MATKTRTRKRAGGKASGKPRRKATPSKNGKAKGAVTAGGSKDDPNQKFIPGTEPLRVPKIDALVARHSDLTASRKSGKDMTDEVLDNIVKEMKDNGLKTYRSNGKLVSVAEGQTVVKIKKASDK
jgi:hypothetical protein